MSLIEKRDNQLFWNSSDTSSLIKNEYMDGLINEDDDDIATENILYGNAKGTENGQYLDPVPFINRMGINYLDARTDEINAGINNMDYTGHFDSSISKILNLLMPQYCRRVEVEDLNKNFWVISLVLDAILHSIWGAGGIIDIIQELINRQNSLYIDNDYLMQKTESIANPEAVCILHPRYVDYFDNIQDRFDLNGDGLWGLDDSYLLLSLYTYKIAHEEEEITEELVVQFISDYLQSLDKKLDDETVYSQKDVDESMGSINGLYGILKYNENLEFNAANQVIDRTDNDFLKTSSGELCILTRSTGDINTLENFNIISGLYAPGFKDLNSSHDIGALKQLIGQQMYQKLQKIEQHISLDSIGVVQMLQIIDTSYISETYNKQAYGLIDTFYKPNSFGFSYQDFYTPEEIVKEKVNNLFGEPLTKIFYVNNDTLKLRNSNDYKWELAVMTTVYKLMDNNVVEPTWGYIPHIFAYQPENAKYILKAAFEDFTSFVHFMAAEGEEIRTERRNAFKSLMDEYRNGTVYPYILLVNETIKEKKYYLISMNKAQVEDFCEEIYALVDNNENIAMFFEREKTSFEKAYDNGGDNKYLEVPYWGEFKRNEYFELMRILSRRIAFKLNPNNGTTYLQNYCYPAALKDKIITFTDEYIENYYLRYDIRKIIPYYYWNKHALPITKVKNYYGPLPKSGVARFRGQYYTPIWPYRIASDDRAIEDEKIYINRVHTPRHEDGEWTQLLEFYTVELTQSNDNGTQIRSYDFGSPHCADITDNYLPATATNWESGINFCMCKVDFYGHKPGITYTTEVEKTWFTTPNYDDAPEGGLENIFSSDIIAW